MLLSTNWPTSYSNWPTSSGISGGGGLIFPPVADKLILWSLGPLIYGADIFRDPDVFYDPDEAYGVYRRDFLQADPGHTHDHVRINLNGDDPHSTWDMVNATYLLPEVPALVSADALEGPFFFDGDGHTVPRTQSEIEAHVAGLGSVFFCARRGIKMYNEILSGQELTDAQGDCQ